MAHSARLVHPILSEALGNSRSPYFITCEIVLRLYIRNWYNNLTLSRLTAFVAKSFRQASTFIHVEESVIIDALQWLADQQASNGSFPEVGKIYHTEMQGGSTYELALSAYTLIAFLENSKTTSQFRNTITRSIEYIVRNLYRITDDSYALSLCTYALHLAEHPEREPAFNALESNAQSNGE